MPSTKNEKNPDLITALEYLKYDILMRDQPDFLDSVIDYCNRGNDIDYLLNQCEKGLEGINQELKKSKNIFEESYYQIESSVYVTLKNLLIYFKKHGTIPKNYYNIDDRLSIKDFLVFELLKESNTWV